MPFSPPAGSRHLPANDLLETTLAFTPARSRRMAIALACACLAWHGSLLAAPDPDSSTAKIDLDLAELMEMRIDTVYGASKYDQRVTQAPSSISIVTADEIERFGHRTLSDVLRSIRGVYVSDDRNYGYVGIRGFLRPNDYNTRVLVLIDGHRLNDNIYDSGTTGHEGMVDVDLIERVEIIRGPSASIYGSSAFLGVINVITKRATAIDGLEISSSTGSHDTYKNRATFGGAAKNGSEWLISGSHYTSAGREHLYFAELDQRISADPRASNDGLAVGVDGEEAYNLFGSVRFEDFTLSAYAADRTKDVPTGSFETVFNDPRTRTEDRRYYIDLKYDRVFDDGLQLTARGFYDRMTYLGVYPYDYAELGAPPDVVLSKEGAIGEYVGSEWQLIVPVLGRHRFIVGGEYRNNLREYQYVYDDVQPREYALYDDRSSYTFGLFAQAEAALLDNLTLSAGVRFDEYSAIDLAVTNPRVALIYSPSPRNAFKLLYGEAFRAPNPYESYYTDGVAAEEPFVRPVLAPETIDTYELVYEQYLGLNYRVNVSAYSYRVRGLISQLEAETGELYFDNLDSVRARGVELEVEGKFDSGALLRASYALQRAEDGEDRELSSSPRHIAKLNASLPIYNDRLYAGVELQYHGSVITLDERRADDFLVTNFTLLGQRIFKGLDISAGVYNVFSTKYAYPGAEDHLQSVIYQDGRTVQAKFTYGF